MGRHGTRPTAALPRDARKLESLAKRIVATGRSGTGSGAWWAICEHDNAYTISSSTRPTPEKRDDGRPIKVAGPYETETEADEAASVHYSRTLAGFIAQKRAKLEAKA